MRSLIYSSAIGTICSASRPVAGYYIAKKTELKAVRMIAVLLKINADKSLIKERLREFYA